MWGMSMDAGRELDALVAEKVMGFVRLDIGAEVLVPSGLNLDSVVWPPRGQIEFDRFVPSYSTTLELAWLIIETLGGEVGVSSPGGSGDCFASVGEHAGNLRRFRTAKTVPHAICLAALEHVGAL